ncbi:MAG: TraR/DksA C4-type zinc finger protein [Bacillota bacterium]
MNHQERYRQQLVNAKEEAGRIVEGIDRQGLSLPLRETVAELSSYDNHPGDIGSETFERSKDLALRGLAVKRLEKIEKALDRMDAGTYGKCLACGKEISHARLEAEPEAEFCIDCSNRMDLPDRHPRPIEEDVIAPPYGGLTHDHSAGEQPDAEDEIMFDGEDTWQILARWNEHAETAQSGSYYGGTDLDEDRGTVDDVEAIPYFKGADGMFYEDLVGDDDEDVPGERTVGDEGWDRARKKPGAGKNNIKKAKIRLGNY